MHALGKVERQLSPTRHVEHGGDCGHLPSRDQMKKTWRDGPCPKSGSGAAFWSIRHRQRYGQIKSYLGI